MREESKIMKTYLAEMCNNMPKENPGYRYLTTESIYLPIMKCTLSITKRRIQSLSLIEETAVKLIHAGLTDIDEIAGILGLERRILDITIADLYHENYIIPTANQCALQKKGIDYINSIKVTKNQTDVLRDVLMNLVTGEISKNNAGIIANCSAHKYKVRKVIVQDELDYLRKNMQFVKGIFNSDMLQYSPNKEIMDELISIDEIKDKKIVFLKLKLHFYYSNEDETMDILAANSNYDDMLNQLKDIIMDEIKNRTLLSDYTVQGKYKNMLSSPETSESTKKLKVLIKEFARDRGKNLFHDEEYLKNIFCDRFLLENELFSLTSLLLKTSSKAEIALDNLSANLRMAEFTDILQLFMNIENKKIYYKFSSNIKKDTAHIKKTFPKFDLGCLIQDESIQEDFRIKFDDRITIIGKTNKATIYDDLSIKHNTYRLKIFKNDEC